MYASWGADVLQFGCFIAIVGNKKPLIPASRVHIGFVGAECTLESAGPKGGGGGQGQPTQDRSFFFGGCNRTSLSW